MIILVNGAFGSGKTTTANILVKRIENSIVFDPEEVGFMVRKVTEGIRCGEEDTDDFQDIEIWKIIVINVARELKEKYRKNLIIPMTIYKENNFKYIVKGLEALSNNRFIYLGRVDSIKNHPIRRLFDNGIKVTINSDDVLIFDSHVSGEYLKLFQEEVFDARELDMIRLNGLA
ncbi:MAG: hypothetical protein N4A68_15720 [Maledivibacter sp.]|jgi:hypothetical protein|nr:hypothetical protein [Maledivibacter sp.]